MTSSPHSRDLEIVQRALRGEDEALTDLSHRLEVLPRIVAARNRQCRRPLGPEDLEDVVQAVMVVVWRKLPEFEARASLTTWMYRISTLELMNRLRKVQRQADRTVPLSRAPEQWEAEASQDVLRGFQHHDLQEAVRALPEEQEAVLRLRHYEELTFEGIAERLGFSTSKAKVLYTAAIEKLRRTLRRQWGSDG